ncbi:Na+/H+ antiporter subunit A [Microbacterium marinilacus]|uniref:Na+/H+ antiporter subunit A n=1 Tax=Microbacterium marinilacus TaxID=415209 RepID=A0ABP7BVS9_9MICO|nr:Na+/H+ antiporter subunit A [Microbacterium marinilacus]MBY0688209.1 Na+/H+ antiporter subunit A [Microbacterium marinilacus]
MLPLLLSFAIGSVLLMLLAKPLGARVFYVAAVFPLAALVHAAFLGGRVLEGDTPFAAYEWIRPLGIEISMRMDTLSWVMALVVSGVGALVMIYCRWYFRGKTDGLGRFSSVLLAFAGAMYGLVLTDDIVMLVMFWEITSILSYLLIGHYHLRAASRRAALQALLVTTLGGLVMLVGVVMLVAVTGTTSLSEILELAPTGALVDVALVLLLVGALSKSAIFPFHFWLPGAMAAPTPVSAYLHAAAMVKAGIYLLARFAPVFGDADPWRPVIVTLGVFTMLLGGVQALRESDLKRILAFGTVSQLGFISVVIGYGTRDAALAGLALLLGHALFKSTLFLVVGVIDRQLSTRDIDELSGVGRQAPVMAVISFVAVASMAGVPPTLGFVAKEGALVALIDAAGQGEVWALVALIGVTAGSMLTVAYGARFLWGAFWTKRDAHGAVRGRTEWPDPPIGFLGVPLVLATLGLAGGLVAPMLDTLLTPYAETAAAIEPVAEHVSHLALWHGLGLPVLLSAVTLVGGAVILWLTRATGFDMTGRVMRFSAADAYYALTRGIDRAAVAVTTLTQRGSLPIYVATIFIVLVVGEGVVLFASPEWRVELDLWQHPAQLAVAPIMIAGGVIAVRSRKRYTGVVLAAITGLGMVTLFAVMGAPDLALTQVLVESVTLIAFALVLRRLPSRMGAHNGTSAPILRALLGAAVGITMAALVVIATSARIHEPVSTSWEQLAYEIGHGRNVVNVALVDLRGWDTMGELSVLILAATGVASLVFVTDRSDTLQRLTHGLPGAVRPPRAKRIAARRRARDEAASGAEASSSPRAWLVGGQKMSAESRSIILEVIVRILFHTIIVVSIYLLFAGHNLPGGGFAGGLVAGMALVMRYIAGGRYELGVAAPTDAGWLLGSGMILAVGTTVAPLLFGENPLTRAVWEADLPVVGHIEFVSSTFFDVGVYLVVIGLVLDVLRSLGAEVDRQMKGIDTPWRASAPAEAGSER